MVWEVQKNLENQTREPLNLTGNNLTLEQVREVAVQKRPVVLHPDAIRAVASNRQELEAMLSVNEPLYGINTGFGQMATTRIDAKDLAKLQKNLVLSHAVGVGASFSREQTRAIILLRANSLSGGASGVRLQLVEALLDLLRMDVCPVIPAQGSVGSSGDLAPLAHLALGMMGMGNVLGQVAGTERLASEALAEAGLQPIQLQAKEGLALLNGTQPMLAIGCEALLRGELCAKTADVIGSITLQTLMGSLRAFDGRIYERRPHPGSLVSAANLRRLLTDSPLIASHQGCGRVQDAYSLRAMPVVHGASRDVLREVRRVLQIEANSVTDNPLIFEGNAWSGANFHGQPVALALDYLAIGLAEFGSIAERRIERLVNPAYSDGLPAFLVAEGGLNSGFMVPQYAAAALASENKLLASPASVDSIPTSAGKEDHVSMGTIAARKALQVATHLEQILAIELLCACQAADLRAPLELSPPTAAVLRVVRSRIPYLQADRWLKPDMDIARELVATGQVLSAAEAVCGALE